VTGVCRTLQDISFTLDAIPSRPEPKRIMMSPPTYCDVAGVDQHRALAQWKQLREQFRAAGFDVVIVPEQAGLGEMMLTAAHGISLLRNGKREVLMGKMKNSNRQEELKYFDVWYRLNKYLVHHCSSNVTMFEGMCDALWHPGKLLLWGGWGMRTDAAVYEQLSKRWELPIIALQLTDERFCHLDKCFCPLNETTALVYRSALTQEGCALIEKFFPQLIEPTEKEAAELFACNAYSPDGKTVLIQRGCDTVIKKLQEQGFSVVEVDTSEFIKLGSSVACLKMMVY
jgi:N-dimethylarginine dimethylaminohydrolase